MWKAYKIIEQIHIPQMYTLFEAQYDSSYSFPGETHDFWECLYVKSGGVCVSADGRVYHLAAGDIVFHKPLELHKFYVDRKDGADLLIFSFSMTGELTGFYEDKVFRLSGTQKEILKSMLDFLHRESSHVYDDSISMQFLQYFETKPIFLQLTVSYLYQFLLSLADCNTVSAASDSFDAGVFRTAVKFMNENISASLSVEQIAKHCKVSPTSLKRVFAKYSGLGVHKYFLKQKITAAANAVKGGMSVTDAADAFGFASQGYFSVAFKRETGVSPTEYKKST
ncbi:MAG: helix-turn-helix transcriptional regulator [Clostridia bacterium]|nr:helix-turn-helix transcriptional regulator [Clostridia bacterium]